MPFFRIEQYEIHVQTYQVEADCEAQAIEKLFAGEADAIDGCLEYIEVAEDLGLPVDEFRELADELFAPDASIGEDVISSIRSIEQVKPKFDNNNGRKEWLRCSSIWLSISSIK